MKILKSRKAYIQEGKKYQITLVLLFLVIQLIKVNLLTGKLGKIFNQINPLEATDITGYGLGNHLINLINRNKNIKGITILKDKIKLFEGVNECLQKNVNSSFYEQNFNYGKNKIFFKKNDLINKIFFDPQTVGGVAFIIQKDSYFKIKNILEKNEIVFSKIGYIDNSYSNLRVI